MLKKILKISTIVTIVLVILGYSYFAFRDYINGPKIIVIEPINGSTISTSTILVKGQAFRIKDISLNGRPILIDENGNFKKIRVKI